MVRPVLGDHHLVGKSPKGSRQWWGDSNSGSGRRRVRGSDYREGTTCGITRPMLPAPDRCCPGGAGVPRTQHGPSGSGLGHGEARIAQPLSSWPSRRSGAAVGVWPRSLACHGSQPRSAQSFGADLGAAAPLVPIGDRCGLGLCAPMPRRAILSTLGPGQRPRLPGAGWGVRSGGALLTPVQWFDWGPWPAHSSPRRTGCDLRRTRARVKTSLWAVAAAVVGS
jgi:hypothetical protein